jgi:hypothetical protein
MTEYQDVTKNVYAEGQPLMRYYDPNNQPTTGVYYNILACGDVLVTTTTNSACPEHGAQTVVATNAVPSTD